MVAKIYWGCPEVSSLILSTNVQLYSAMMHGTKAKKRAKLRYFPMCTYLFFLGLLYLPFFLDPSLNLLLLSRSQLMKRSPMCCPPPDCVSWCCFFFFLALWPLRGARPALFHHTIGLLFILLTIYDELLNATYAAFSHEDSAGDVAEAVCVSRLRGYFGLVESFD